MRTRTIVIGAVVIGALAAGGYAAYARMNHVHGMHTAMANAMFDEVDQNKDGTVTRAEVDTALQARFTAADADRDGKLNPAEFDNARPKPPEGVEIPDFVVRHMQSAFKRVDWNLDGAVSLEEWTASARFMAAMADRDGNGEIKREDLNRPWRRHHGPRG